MSWKIWIDRGGTFTDIVARRPDGAFSITKLLNEDGGSHAEATIAGIRSVVGVSRDAPLPPGLISEVRIGTTIATNALLERTGAPTLLVVNQGFADLPLIGHQARPRLFDLDIRKPPPLHARVMEISARIDAAGRQIASLDESAVRMALAEARLDGLGSCAIALIHAWRFPDLERRVADLAREAGFTQISVSSDASPLIGLLPRMQTAIVDAYLSPGLGDHVSSVARFLADANVSFMSSDGGLASPRFFSGKDAILSGPAGGVVGAARGGEAAGYSRVIGFDMGGTSTDVSIYAGTFERSFETEIAGVALRTPMMAVHTVAAGGGSILGFDGARCSVGPESAGASPGPACYRRGGPLTVTDANVFLGRIQPGHFPALFGAGGDQPLDADIVAKKFVMLAEEMFRATGRRQTAEAVAEGFLQIAVANMAGAISQISLEKGRDPRDYALQAFGGAAGQLACRVADELGMSTILLHPFAGVLSAYGIGLAEHSKIRRQTIERALDEACVLQTRDVLAGLSEQAAAAFPDAVALSRRLTVELSYKGTDAPVAVDFASLDDMRAAFESAHRARFGFVTPDRSLILQSCTVEVTLPGDALALTAASQHGPAPAPVDRVDLWVGGQKASVTIFERAELREGDKLTGPALVREATSTIVIDPGWDACVAPDATLVLTRPTRMESAAAANADTPDPILLELFANQFMAAAERMGAVLRSTSTSINIRERLDFSCALFDARGNLIANAPHVPVHLGAMGESVRAVLRARGSTLRPGDMIALNNPFNGGTHLPDVTVIAPVFDTTGDRLCFFVGNRGHHADIGGITPGSTPPGSTRLEEEGVVLDDVMLVSAGAFCEANVRRLLNDAPWPARSPDTNISDLRAQIAANRAGQRELEHMVDRYSWPVVDHYMRHVQADAEERVRKVIDRLHDSRFDYRMDDGSLLRVAVSVDRAARSALIDFTGTSAQRPGNFNAPPAVTRAAVLYVFRCLVNSELPLNEGCLAPLEIVLPEGSFLSPASGAAVVAGNTEVSQAVVSALLGALGASAASQSTMNNLLLGNDQFQYYETICGGAGAGPGFDGADAVHTHMTNTRITDPEELELRCPVMLDTFEIRRGSGGAGAHRGGDGVIRRIRVTKPVTLSLVASRRSVAPFGLGGGSPGLPGRQFIQRASGLREDLGGVAQAELEPGDAIVIETPGGGGFGKQGRT